VPALSNSELLQSKLMFATCAMGLNGLAGPLGLPLAGLYARRLSLLWSGLAHIHIAHRFSSKQILSFFHGIYSLYHIVKIQIFHNNIYLINRILNFATTPQQIFFHQNRFRGNTYTIFLLEARNEAIAFIVLQQCKDIFAAQIRRCDIAVQTQPTLVW
jgi:hypothetical protein